MADETNQQKLEKILNARLSLDEVNVQLAAIFPESCERKVERQENTSKECLDQTGNPVCYRHCVTITNCDDDRDNMAKTCGQWHCVG